MAPPAPSSPADPLALFHPVIGRWFRDRLGEPTEVQRAAWPVIAAGRHALVTAPTGSGKTLTAFLWALDRLLGGAWEGGRTRVLYVSPLKALNNDVRQNLLAPLAELTAALRAAGREPPAVRVATRSGDTPGPERQRMARRPPEVLITTPESLNLLLTSRSGRALLGGLETVILDEVHAVAPSKRGTHLITAVERLTLLAGEFQRLALSATVRPRERIAAWVGGFRLTGGERAGAGGEPGYRPREIAIVAAPGAKAYDLEVRFPAAPGAAAPAAPWSLWDEGRCDEPTLFEALAAEFKARIRANRSTLVFANSRRTTERVTGLLNQAEPEDLAYSHHGSLAREIRAVVEQRLKEGRLRAIVATNSLELGIDIGHLDEVLLVQTPPSVASALQRIGRAGHGVGEVSRGRFYPTHARDLVCSAVVARAVLEQAIEEVKPLAGCLDVLAQVVLSMVVADEWPADALYAFLRTCWPYRRLARRDFDRVLEMLGGRYAEARLPELRPRVALDRVTGTVRARPGAERLLYTAGGTIPDRGYFHLRLDGSMAKLGELDEEFVWERTVGDSFTLGAQSWRIRHITHNDVLVVPARGAGGMAPFWRADARDRSFEFADRVGRFLEVCEGRLAAGQGDAELLAWLARDHCLAPAAGRELLALLRAQRAMTGAALPHRHHLLAETAADPTDCEEAGQLLLHTGWGGKVNRPLALLLAAAWEKRHGWPLEVAHDDACVLVKARGPVAAEELFALLAGERLLDLLRERLEGTGFFGAHFRVNAGCALLLPRSDARRRQPLWLIRERSKRLLEAVSRTPDFPVVLETWRSCLEDEMELPALERLLAEVASGEIRLTSVRTERPSPLAADMVWRRTNQLMYADDTPEGGRHPAVGRDLLRELVFASELRPRLPAVAIERLERKLQRTAPGYAPATPEELVEWLKERLLIPRGEWRGLLAAIAADAGAEWPGEEAFLAPVAGRLTGLRLPGAAPEGAVVAVETVGRLLAAVAPARPVPLADLLDPAAPPGPVARGALGGAASRLGLVLVGAGGAAPAIAAGPESPGGEADAAVLEDLLAEWLRFYGPLSQERITAAFGLAPERQAAALEALVEAQRVVVDVFRAGEEALQVAEAESLERLLRLVRAAARPRFEPVPLCRLPLFLAAWQGLARRGSGVEDLQAALERLFGFPAPARLWEGEILPARLDPYWPSWLDALLADTDLTWVGCGRERLTFALAADLPLLSLDPGGAPEPPAASALFPDPRGKFSLADLARRAGLGQGETARRLWDLAWRGEVATSGFQAVRQGILGRFQADEPGVEAPASGPARRVPRRFDRWRPPRAGAAADWHLLAPAADPAAPPDALEREERNKDRARLLLDRYGVLFRELLLREVPPLQWGELFRALRIMELGGEVLSGHFFTGVPGLQFMAPAAFRRLADGLPEDAIYWMSAADPASPCALGLPGLPDELPPRHAAHHLVFHGDRLVLVGRGNGRSLDVRVPPADPHLPRYLEVVKILLTRQAHPVKELAVETINGEPAPASPYAAALAAGLAATRDVKAIRLRRRYA